MVAAEAGVSTATVSYVLSGRAGSDKGVSDDARAKVLEAARRLDYVPNRAAQSIRTGRTRLVQLSLNMLSDPWSLAVAAAVNATANQHGLITTILADHDWFTAIERYPSDVAYIDNVTDQPDAARLLATLVSRGQRLVVFSETLEPNGFDVIRSDAIPGCYLAVDHLLENHRRIGCLTTRAALEATGVSRYTPYAARLADAAIEVRPGDVCVFENSQPSAFSAAVRLLSQTDRPTAVYATTDFAAIAAINAAHMLGLRVPHDVAIVGVGNTPDARLVAPTLTTVGPTDFYARQAGVIVRAALADAQDPSARPALHDFPWTLHCGASTDLDEPEAPRPEHRPATPTSSEGQRSAREEP
ncbi:LacI family DNA-binding transcriptional regulator [Monashia sp. NPDC004114]